MDVRSGGRRERPWMRASAGCGRGASRRPSAGRSIGAIRGPAAPESASVALEVAEDALARLGGRDAARWSREFARGVREGARLGGVRGRVERSKCEAAHAVAGSRVHGARSGVQGEEAAGASVSIGWRVGRWRGSRRRSRPRQPRDACRRMEPAGGWSTTEASAAAPSTVASAPQLPCWARRRSGHGADRPRGTHSRRRRVPYPRLPLRPHLAPPLHA